MARRLISIDELDLLEGLVEEHRRLQERLEALERQAAQYDAVDPSALELSRRADALRRELAGLLGGLLVRVNR